MGRKRESPPAPAGGLFRWSGKRRLVPRRGGGQSSGVEENAGRPRRGTPEVRHQPAPGAGPRGPSSRPPAALAGGSATVPSIGAAAGRDEANQVSRVRKRGS